MTPPHAGQVRSRSSMHPVYRRGEARLGAQVEGLPRRRVRLARASQVEHLRQVRRGVQVLEPGDLRHVPDDLPDTWRGGYDAVEAIALSDNGSVHGSRGGPEDARQGI